VGASPWGFESPLRHSAAQSAVMPRTFARTQSLLPRGKSSTIERLGLMAAVEPYFLLAGSFRICSAAFSFAISSA
jgi:hypothetical protein